MCSDQQLVQVVGLGLGWDTPARWQGLTVKDVIEKFLM